MGIKAIYPKVKTTKANKEHNKYPYLLNEFKNNKGQVEITAPNQVWSSDITYIRLENGYAYLAAIIDWHTKKILSWKLSNTMDVNLTTSVLKTALELYPKPEIFNSDQGSQYTAKEHIEILKQNNISISMDAKGRSIDNIVIERFWRTIKYEEIYPSSYKNIKEARKGIEEYIKIYNNERLHSALDYKTPDEVYYKGANDKSYNEKKVSLDEKLDGIKGFITNGDRIVSFPTVFLYLSTLFSNYFICSLYFFTALADYFATFLLTLFYYFCVLFIVARSILA